MVKNIIQIELEKYKRDIDCILDIESIDCITIFSSSEIDYQKSNSEIQNYGRVIDEMESGNLFYIEKGIETSYGKLYFIKVRKYDKNYIKYRISVDFIVKDYLKFKNNLINPVVKVYENFELIQFKNDHSIINVVSLSAKDEYEI